MTTLTRRESFRFFAALATAAVTAAAARKGVGLPVGWPKQEMIALGHWEYVGDQGISIYLRWVTEGDQVADAFAEDSRWQVIRAA